MLTKEQEKMLAHAREMTILGVIEVYWRNPEMYLERLYKDREAARALGCLTYEDHTNCVEFYDEIFRRLGIEQ